MHRTQIADIAHLLRRAGFGATRDELEEYAARGYEATVEELLHPDEAPAFEDDDLLRRYHIDQNDCRLIGPAQTYWLYRMINTSRPLEGEDSPFLAPCLCEQLYQSEPGQDHADPDRSVPAGTDWGTSAHSSSGCPETRP